MPVNEDGVFVCELCGEYGIETWPYVHCWKCGHREDRPDIGLTADGQPTTPTGAVFGGGTPDEETQINVPSSQGEQPPVEDFPPGWTKDENGEWIRVDIPPETPSSLQQSSPSPYVPGQVFGKGPNQ